MTTIEEQISTIYGHALAIVQLLESELSERVIYLHRSYLLICLAGDVIEVMARTEAVGVESDFHADWHKLRQCLTNARQQFEAIVAGGDCLPTPLAEAHDWTIKLWTWWRRMNLEGREKD